MDDCNYTETGTASWPKETVRERIQKIPEVIDLLGGFDRVRFTLTLTYDPNCPDASFLLKHELNQTDDMGNQKGKKLAGKLN